MRRPLRIAVIGTGRWGKNIIRTLRTLPTCKVAYTATHDYQRLLKKNDIDGAVIATPATTHAAIASAFIKKGAPVFIEKPFTAKLGDAKKLATLAKKHHVSIFVGHIHLYNPAYLALKKHIKRIGPIRSMIAEGTNNGPARDDVSAMWDWAPHDISLMLDLVGKKPVSVQAWGISPARPHHGLYDTTAMKILFPGSIAGHILSSWAFPEKRKRLFVIGKKGSLIFNDVVPEKKMTLHLHSKISFPFYQDERPLTAELTAWLGSIGTNRKILTDIREGLQVMEVLDAAERSIEAHGRAMRC